MSILGRGQPPAHILYKQTNDLKKAEQAVAEIVKVVKVLWQSLKKTKSKYNARQFSHLEL